MSLRLPTNFPSMRKGSGPPCSIRRVTASLGADQAPSAAQAGQVRDATGLADLWLDEVTDLAAPGLIGRAWSRAEWVEATMPRWAAFSDLAPPTSMSYSAPAADPPVQAAPGGAASVAAPVWRAISRASSRFSSAAG